MYALDRLCALGITALTSRLIVHRANATTHKHCHQVKNAPMESAFHKIRLTVQQASLQCGLQDRTVSSGISGSTSRTRYPISSLFTPPRLPGELLRTGTHSHPHA